MSETTSTKSAVQSPSRRTVWLAYAMLSLTMLLWSGNFIIGRGLREQFSPATLSLARWVLTALVIVPFAWPHLQRQWPLILRNWKILLLLSLCIVTIGNTLVYVALESTTAINGALVNAVQPVTILIVSWLLFRESISRLQGVGIALSLTGVLLVITKADFDAVLELRFNIGDFWMFLSIIAFSFYAVLHRRAPHELHPIALMQVISAVGALFIVPLYLIEDGFGGRFELTPVGIASIVYLAVFCSFIAILFWNRGLALIGANRAGVFIYLLPVFSSILSIVILDEPLGGYHLVGFAFIIVGIYVTTQLATRKRRAKAA